MRRRYLYLAISLLSLSFLMFPSISGQEAIANDGSVDQDGINKARSLEDTLVWVIILLIAFWMIWGALILIIFKFERKPKERTLWSFSPMKGPSVYEKENIKDRLASLDHGDIHRSDLETMIEEDLERWDRDLDPLL